MATASVLRSLEEVLKLSKQGGAICPVPDKGHRATGRLCKTVGQVVANARWAADAPGSQGVLLCSPDGTYHELHGEVLDKLDDLVPTQGRQDPLVAFVGASPSAIDAARGEPLSGLDGDVFRKAYLEPLGLKREEVLVTNLLPHAGNIDPQVAKRYAGFAKAELQAYAPRMCIALGKAARTELGKLASECLPHPAVLRRQGDNGEVTRKIKRLKGEIEKLRKGPVKKVHIAKFLPAANDVSPILAPEEKQVIYGVVLDPYQLDSQDDYLDTATIEKTAHNWLKDHRVIGLMHESQLVDAYVVESWLWPYPSETDYRNALQNLPHQAYEQPFGSDMVRSGAWVLGTEVQDPAAWQAIVNGELDAYSIGGYGTRSPFDVADMPQVTFIS